MNKKGFALLLILLVVVALIIVGGAIWYHQSQKNTSGASEQNLPCCKMGIAQSSTPQGPEVRTSTEANIPSRVPLGPTSTSGGSKVLINQTWGAPEIQVDIGTNSSDITIPCEIASINEEFIVNASGSFDLMGTGMEGGGSGVGSVNSQTGVISSPAPAPTEYKGTIEGDTMHLTVGSSTHVLHQGVKMSPTTCPA